MLHDISYLKHIIDSLTSLGRCLKVLKSMTVGPQLAFSFLHHSLLAIDLQGQHTLLNS